MVYNIKHMEHHKKGFTIIEVVLVLAIAGLIFLMVFVALPALQRSQRNTQVRRDGERIFGLVADYQKNNHGKLPFDAKGNFDTNFITRYVDENCVFKVKYRGGDYTEYYFRDCGEQFTHPIGNIYTIKIMDGDRDYNGRLNTTNYYTIHFYAGVKCGELENQMVKAEGPRKYAMVVKLETVSYYCTDNS